MLDDFILGFVVGAVCFLTALAMRPALARHGTGLHVGVDRGAVADWLADARADAGRADADPPVVHEVPRDVSECVVPGFRPGVDTCRITLNDADADFDALVTDADARFLFLDAGSLLEVVFPGLASPPFADAVVIGPDGKERKLSDLVSASCAPAGTAIVLQRFHAGVAEFRAFSAASELVEIWVPPDLEAAPEVVVRPTADGIDGEVVINGRPAARLCGAPEAGARNVRIVRRMPADYPAETGRAASAAGAQGVGATS